MKEGWTYKTLGEIADVIHGKNQKEVISANGVYPIYGSGGNIMGYASDYLCEAGTTILGRKGSINNPLYISERFWNVDTAFGISAKKGIDGKFLYYFITTVDWLKKNTGTTLPSLTQQVVKSVILPIPSLSEQQQIVERLDAAFAKIDALKVNAQKQLNEAKALFQASLKEMLEPKEGWEEKKLGEICSDIRYGTSTPSHENGEYKYLRMNNITNDGFLDVSHYKTISLPLKELEKCLVKKGDIIFNRTNSRELVGKSCVFTEDENMVIAGYLIRIRLKDGFEPQFITYSMNLQRSLGLFRHLIVGAVHQANISANNIQKVIINYPPLSEQQSIVVTLDSLKSKVDRLQENFDMISHECDALKQAMLREVFSEE